MAALESMKFVPLTFPSNVPFCNNQSFWPAKTSQSIRSLSTSDSQKTRRPATAFSSSGCQAEYGNTGARAECYNETDDDLPSFEELFSIAPPPKTSTKSSKTERTLQHLKQPALGAARIQADQTKSAAGDNPDQPMILDDDDSDKACAGDEAEGAIGNIDTGRVERDASPHNTLVTSELALEPVKSIDASCSWDNAEDGCYINGPAPGLGSCQGVPSAPTQDQTQILPQSPTPLQDQINQQDIGNITQSMSVESVPQSLPKPFNHGNDGWTDDSMAELEKELGLALEEEQVESSPAGAPTSPSPRSVEAPEDEIQSRERSETSSSRSEEPRHTCQRGTPALPPALPPLFPSPQVFLQPPESPTAPTQGPKAGSVEIQQQEELVGQNKELGRPALGDQQNLVEVDDTDDPMDKEATEALPATQLGIDKHRFRLRGVRVRQLPGRQTKTTQYRVVWGEHPNRSDSWFNQDDVQISMPCEPYSQDPALQVDIFRVCRMRSSLRKGRNVFEYLVDMFGFDSYTWTTEDQLRISLSPMLVAELKASSPHPLSEAQRDVLLRHSATPISDEYRHASRASRSSAPADPALGGKPATMKRGHQDMHTEISSDTHHSVNTDDNHNTCDTSDEDPRPAKRRKSRSAPAATPTTCRGHTPELHVGQPGSLVALSTATPEIDDAQPQVDHECPSTFVDNSHQHASRTSRSPSEASEAAPFAESWERPLHCFLKCTKIGSETTYNLEFKLPSISGHLHLPIDPKALDINHDAAAHSKIHQAPLQPKKRRVKWTPKEEATLFKMWNDGCLWEEIAAALPGRSEGTIRVRCSTKFKK